MSVSEIRDWHSSLRTAPRISLRSSGLQNATKCMRRHPTPRSCEARPSPPGNGEKRSVLRRAAPELCSAKNEKLRARSRRMAAGGAANDRDAARSDRPNVGDATTKNGGADYHRRRMAAKDGRIRPLNATAHPQASGGRPLGRSDSTHQRHAITVSLTHAAGVVEPCFGLCGHLLVRLAGGMRGDVAGGFPHMRSICRNETFAMARRNPNAPLREHQKRCLLWGKLGLSTMSAIYLLSLP